MVVLEPDSYPQQARIGSKLRHARISQHLTIRQVADSAGLTEGFVSRLERDLTSPSVATLVTICAVLRIDIGELLTRTEVARVSWDETPKLTQTNDGVSERLLTPRSENRIQVIHSEFSPGSSGNSMNYAVNAPIHFVHIVQGGLTIALQNDSWELNERDSLTFDGRELHSWKASEARGAIVLWCLSPATGE